MDIDQRDIEKGALPEILPKFYSDSISYLSELNACRMYAEIWSNKRSKEREKRREIRHEGYLKTLESGEGKKRRKVDRVRFGSFVVADSINYKIEKNIYGDQKVFMQMGGIQTNSILNKIIKAKTRISETKSLLLESDFHSEGYLTETLELDLEELGLHQDKKSNKYYFEISTNVDDISNQNQKILLFQVLGRDDIFEKLHLLYEVGRKQIRCLIENPENVIKTAGTSKTIPRLCVAWPFHETLVFDFAGTPEEYGEACLLGTLIKTTEGQAKSEEAPGEPRIDSYA
jgi:hypothetical protein